MRSTDGTIDRTRILTASEIGSVLTDLQKRGKRSVNSRQNEIIFRLSTCCGLRVSEIVGITLANVVTTTAKPHISIPAAIAKRKKARKIPLWWDSATLQALADWKAFRLQQGAKASGSFVCSQSEGTTGKALITRNAQGRWKAGIRALGKDRVKMLSIHCGRHSFCSHALNGGRSLLEVRDAAGHSSIATTSIYLHVVNQDDGTVGDLFKFG